MGNLGESLRGRILVGESLGAAGGVLTAALAAEGYEVCVAREAVRDAGGDGSGGSPGTEGKTAAPFDVIVWSLDGRSPPPAQLERRLRDPSVARALILVSGAGRLATAVEAQRLGATAVLARPVDPAALFRAVETALGNA